MPREIAREVAEEFSTGRGTWEQADKTVENLDAVVREYRRMKSEVEKARNPEPGDDEERYYERKNRDLLKEVDRMKKELQQTRAENYRLKYENEDLKGQLRHAKLESESE